MSSNQNIVKVSPLIKAGSSKGGAGESEPSDLAGHWEVPLNDGVHVVEFEHGTVSGRRLIRVDGQVVRRIDWQFKLVGEERFRLGPEGAGGANCAILIDPSEGFDFHYTLLVNGKPHRKFAEAQSRILKCWIYRSQSPVAPVRICMERNTLDVYANNKRLDVVPQFCEDSDGSEMHFNVQTEDGQLHQCRIKSTSSGNRREGIVQMLFIDDELIPEATASQLA